MLKPKAAATPEQLALAANFTRALAESGVAPKAIAEARDITEQAVSNWKRTGKIAREHLPTIASLTGWSVERLLGSSVQETAPPLDENDPVQTMPTIGATILQLGALLGTLNAMGRASIAPLITKVIENPDLAADAAAMADAIAQSQRLHVKDSALSRSFARAQANPVETGLTPLEPTKR
jgi:hypothetical protein